MKRNTSMYPTTYPTAPSACAVLAAALAAWVSGAPLPAQPAGFRVETVVTGIDNACAMAFAPDGRLFVAERLSGRIRTVANGQLSGAWASVPVVGGAGSEAGLLGIAVDPAFQSNGYVYVYYSTSGRRGWETVVARLEEHNGVGTNRTEISPRMPTQGRHVGGPLVFGRDRRLYLAVGDGAIWLGAQHLGGPHGKILRFATPDGAVPADNPFANVPGAFPWTWSYGHRNPFGLSVHPDTGDLYETENGGGSDELNRIVRGQNFGWPLYNGFEPVPDPVTEDPLWAFRPEPALVGAAFYAGALYPARYRGRWFVAGHNFGELFEVDVDAAQGSVRGAVPFHRFGAAFDVDDGPDGNLYALVHDTPRERGADRVVRFVHDAAPSPSLDVTAVSNVAVGGSLTFGAVGQNGDTVVTWLAFRRLQTPVQTPFGLLHVPADLPLPATTITADRRTFLGLPIGDDPNLRGLAVWAQAATVQGQTIRLTNADSHVLY